MRKVNKLISCLSLFLLAMVPAFSQTLNVSGEVRDNKGQTMPGVSVLVKGTLTGTVTDNDGLFSISVTKGTVLEFSFLGFEDKDVPVTDERNIDVIMNPQTLGLNEVVVVGYGTQSRSTLTTAISRVDGDVLSNVPVNTVGEGLKGKIAGVRFYSNNNTPGADVTIRIRGGSSINRSNEPLILVDGIERGIAGINSNDIKSIEVLKDAASTAIYGSRASNGVVLITTKSGVPNQAPTVTFEATTALEQAETLYDFMNSRDYISTVRPAVALGPKSNYNFADGYSASSGNTESSIYSTRYLKDGESIPKGYQSMPDPLDPTKTLIFQDNDFQKEIFRNALWQNYYMGVSGGSNSVNYFVSTGYTDDSGVGLGTDFSRLSIRGNIDIKITDKLKFSSGADYSKVISSEYPNQMNIISRGLATPPTQKKYFDNGKPTQGYNVSSPNPLFYDYYNDNSSVLKRMSFFGKLSYYIVDGLKADAQLSIFDYHRQYDSFQKANVFSSLRTTTEAMSETYRNKFETYLTYNKTFGKHSISAMAGYSYQRTNNNSMSATVTGASSDKVPTLSAGPNKSKADSDPTKEVTIGYFGRLSYDFQKKYLFSATFREDGSSRFAEGHRWGFFPGGSIGWVMSKEEFMKDVTFINNLKWRVSYGQTGNNSVGFYDAFGRYSASAKYDDEAGIEPSAMPNEDLTWEVSTQLDAGFDLSLLDSRININADYFNKVTDNLLFSKELPNTSGFSSILTNVGKVRFYGFDIEISTLNIEKEDFTWNSKFTWSFVKNKVLKLPDNGRDKNRIGGITLADGTAFGGIAEGEPLYRYYGYIADHILETQEQADNAMFDNKAKGYRHSDGKKISGRKEVGDYEWKNREGSDTRNGKDYISSQDQFFLGYTVPHSTGGFINNFRYKNFGLDITLDWALGHSINHNSEMRYFMNTFANNYTLIDKVKKCWKQPGDNTKYARFTANDPDDGNANFSRTSNIFNYKGDYLCIREVNFTYEIPSKILERFHVKNIALTLTGNNLYYFTKVKGVSPEIGASTTYSGSYYNYPPIRKYSIGVKFTF